MSFPLSGVGAIPAAKSIVEVDVADPNAAYVASLDTNARAAFFLALLGPGTETVEILMPDGGPVGTTRGGCLSSVREAMFGNLEVAVGGEMLALNAGFLALDRA